MGIVDKRINGPFSCPCLLRPELEKGTLKEGRRVKCFGCRRRLERLEKGKGMRCFFGEMTVRVMGTCQGVYPLVRCDSIRIGVLLEYDL